MTQKRNPMAEFIRVNMTWRRIHPRCSVVSQSPMLNPRMPLDRDSKAFVSTCRTRGTVDSKVMR